MDDKPRKRTPSAALFRRAESMRKRPGVWMNVPTTEVRPYNIATRIKAGQMPAFPPHLYEARTKNRKPQARYWPENRRHQENQ